MRSDGSSKPARVHMRDPSFVNLQAFAPMVKDLYIADVIATLAMLDPILGRNRPLELMSLGDKVTRYAHGSRVPGWDEAVDLTKDPGHVPDPATVAGPRRTCGRRSRATWPSTPTAARRRSRRCGRPSACYGWCSPRAISRSRRSCA